MSARDQPMDEDVPNNVEAQEDEEEEAEYVVEAIIDKTKEDGVTKYFIKWEGYPEDQNTWEPVDNLNCAALIEQFEENLANSKKKTTRGRPPRRRSQIANSNASQTSSQDDASRRFVDSSDTEDDEVQEIITKKPTNSRRPLEKVPEKEPSPVPLKYRAKGFARNLNLDDSGIISAFYDEDDKLYFIVRWKDREPQFETIAAEELEENAPRELCVWYRKRMYQDRILSKDEKFMDYLKERNEHNKEVDDEN